MTRAPTTCARQHRSSASPWAGMPSSKPFERVEQVDADEHATGRDHEDVPHRVVLLLVELSGLTERNQDAGLVGPHPDREQPQRVVPFDELRADDAGVRPEGLLDELADRGGLERHVVVEEAEEPRAFDELQRLVRGRSEPRVGVEPADVGPGKPGGDRCSHVACRCPRR